MKQTIASSRNLFLAVAAVAIGTAVLHTAAPAATTPVASAPASATATPEMKTVAALYDTWVKTVTSAHGDPASVLKLYAPDAILVATYSPVLLHNDNGELAGYFKKFTALPGLKANTQDLQTRIYGDMAINTGLYTFFYSTPDGDKAEVPARFTFVYRKVGDQWLIVDHHSSLVPIAL